MIFIDYLTCSSVLPSMAPDLSPGYPAYGIHNTMGDSDQRVWIPNLYTGEDVYTQVLPTYTVLSPCEDSQASNPAAVLTQPLVIGAQGSAPMDWEASLQGTGVEQQQPILRDHTETLNYGKNLAEASAGPTPQGVSREKCGDEWTGALYLNGICAHARAQATEAARNPYAHSFRGTCISLTSTQNSISVAKAFAT